MNTPQLAARPVLTTQTTTSAPVTSSQQPVAAPVASPISATTAAIGARVGAQQIEHYNRWGMLSALGATLPSYVGHTVKSAWSILRGTG
jgi:hypothetical protein